MKSGAAVLTGCLIVAAALLLLSTQADAQSSALDDIVKQGVSLWKDYCSIRDANQTYIMQVNECMLKSVSLNDKLMMDCLKKHLPSLDGTTSLQRLHQAQCFNPKSGEGHNMKLNDVSLSVCLRISAPDTTA